CLLNAPATGQAKVIATAAIALDLVAFLLSLSRLVTSLAGGHQGGQELGRLASVSGGADSKPLLTLIMPLQLATYALFLFFLRWLADYVGDKKRARRAMVIFGAAVVIGLAAVSARWWMVGLLTLTSNPVTNLLLLILLVPVPLVVVFVMYGN